MLKGIDVSTLQGKIDWTRVRREGVDFAMIKATQGRGETAATEALRKFTDSRFETNLAEATNAGIVCGAYHYFTASSAAECDEEACCFLDTIRPQRGKLALWAAVDVESERYLAKLDRARLTALTRRFLHHIEDAGFRPMLYTNPNYLLTRFSPGAFDKTDIWLAHWGVSKPYSGVNPKIWQFGVGRLGGISTEVDHNYGYFDLDVAEPPKYAVGDKYTVKAGDMYTNGKSVPARLVGASYTISQVKDDRILLRELVSWVKI